MSTLFKTLAAVGLVVVLTGITQAALVGTDLGTPGVDPLLSGDVVPFGAFVSVKGGGSGIGGTSDHGFFAYQEMAGDGTLVVQVFDFGTGSSVLREGGLMIRDSLDADAINVANLAMYLPVGLDRRVDVQTRTETGGDTAVDESAAGNKGMSPWLMLTRTGNVFQAFYSKDTIFWTPFPETWTVPMDGSVFVGLAVTSNENTEATTFTFRNLSITGFSAPTTLTWNESGDNLWDTPNWLGGPPATPDRTTNVVLADTNTDRVTIGAPAEALSLTLSGGELGIDAGQSLTVYGSVIADTDTLLELGAGATLTVFGGNIPKMAAWRGDATVENAALLSISHLQGNGIYPGTFTKRGAGVLQLDNSPSGGIFAETTTFKVEDGILASKGTHPFGYALGVILDGGDLVLENPGAISSNTAITLLQDASVDVTSAGAALGPLTLDQVKLTTSGTGGVAFASTGISFSGAGSVEFNTGMDTATGPISLGADPVTINKTGGANLIVNGLGANMANATFNVQQGGLVAVHSSNPVEGAALVLAGGKLILANNGPDNPAVFDNALQVTANSTLTGGTAGLPVSGPKSVQLGSAGVHDINVGGNTLTVGTTDGYTLDLAGTVLGTGTVTMADGSVVASGGAALGRLNVNGGTLTTTSLAAIDYVRVSGGTLNTAAGLTTPRLNITGGTVNAGSVLNVTSLEIGGGAVNTANLLNATMTRITAGTLTTTGPVTAGTLLAPGGTVHMVGDATAADVVLSGSALVSANRLVVSNNLRADTTLYSISAGTFEASSTNFLAGGNFAFGGNTLTVSNTNGLVGRWTFDDETANDSSGNEHNGVLVGGSYSTDVPAVLGGKSLNLTGGDYYVTVDTNNNPTPDLNQKVFDLDTLTVAVWVKGWPDNDWEPFVSKRGESNQGWQLRKAGGTADQVAFTLRGAGGDYWANPQNINDGGWHLVVGTYDGATEAIYIDGVLNVSRPQTGAIADTGSRLVFGARDNSGGGTASYGNFSSTMLDDIYIYDRALSDAEITALFNNTMVLKPALDLPNSNFKVTANATLVADTTETATLGNLSLDPGVQLVLQTEATKPISFGKLTAGDGSEIIGDLAVRGEISVGSSVGVLDVIGNLTLAGTSVYNWELDATGSDLINVSKKLTLKNGWTLKIVTDQPFETGKKYLLFTYGGPNVAPAAPLFDVSEAAGWSAGGLEMDIDRDGNVFLVPEPATWILLLTAGAIGLWGCLRRRRAA
jgi:hypothetical protein